TAGRMIDRLETKGWVERRAEVGDRRVKRVHLSAEGRRVHAKLWPIAELTVDDAPAGLSASEAKELMKLPTRVKESLVAIANGSAANSAMPAWPVVADVDPARRVVPLPRSPRAVRPVRARRARP